MNVVISGGGTGGHIYPALAIRGLLQDKYDVNTFYVGISGGLEEKIVKNDESLPFYPVRAQGMPRKPCLKFLTFPFVNLMGVVDALRHLREIKPELVIATGGFTVFPVLTAARILGIKYLIHEQNAVMGLTNRTFASKAEAVMLTYPVEGASERWIVTGNPVRAEFFNESNRQVNEQPDKSLTVLSVGGSRGALSLNKAVVELANSWLGDNPQIQFIHVSGDRDYQMVREKLVNPPENYVLKPYIQDMKSWFDKADIVISRAGATILSEIAVCAKPAILIPFPYATDNHQHKNALELVKQQAAVLLPDSELSGERLAQELNKIADRDILKKMSVAMGKTRPENVEQKIVEILDSVIKQNCQLRSS